MMTGPMSEKAAYSLIASPAESFTVPPFDELTLFVYGSPKDGKTWFCSGKPAGNPKAYFIATEPGHEFIRNASTKIYDVGLRDYNAANPNAPLGNYWQLFQMVVRQMYQIKQAGKLPYNTAVIDIVDNLYNSCLEHVCGLKKLAYPPENDFGKTWNEIRKEWDTWVGRLMGIVDVVFITHATQEAADVEIAPGITKSITRTVPTFRGKKTQFIDGVVNAIGYCRKNARGEYMVTFKGGTDSAAGDRTGILEALGEMPNNWAMVAKAYEAKAKELGLGIRSKHV